MIFNGNLPKIRASLLIALAEGAVQSYLLIFMLYINGGDYRRITMIETELMACVLICFVLYLFLYRMYGSKPETFIYSVGFLSCCYATCLFNERLAEVLIPSYIRSPYTVFIHMLLFISVFYSHASLCECNGKPDKTSSLFLAVTIIFFTVLAFSEFLYVVFPMAMVCLPIFGTYCICCLILKKTILTTRIFSWSMFLMSLLTTIRLLMYFRL